jgi:hypothetical protein
LDFHEKNVIFYNQDVQSLFERRNVINSKKNKVKVKIKYGNMQKYEWLLVDSKTEAKNYVAEIKKLRPDVEYQIVCM